MYWVLDFDDTLALGPNTWAFETALPELVEKHHLPFDRDIFESVMLSAQEKANLSDDEDAVVQYMFDSLKWDIALKDELISRVYNDYQPTLFEDTLPFLNQLKAQNDTILIVSNNAYAPYLMEQLGIASYAQSIFTPKSTQKRRKPYHEMWSDVLAITGDDPVYVVGDDPWSDGLFAEGNPQAQAWIIDRLQRYPSLHNQMSYRFVTSLLDILEK